MKESNEYIHYSASLVYKNIYTLFGDFRNVRIYLASVWLSHTPICNYKTVMRKRFLSNMHGNQS